MSTPPNDPSNSYPDIPSGREPATDSGPAGAPHSEIQHTGPHPDVARRKGIKHTRAGATWTGLVIGIIVLILLLVFILQNLGSVTLQMFGWDFTLPLGVTILIAAIAGAVIMALAGGVRIIQIRRAANRQRRLTAEQ
ncbi:MAG: lipopolysaccharide assembly protein LapA domain-containing protein [Rhodococcus sp. (in: high G+C Gram-positive bacteria)]|uniref:LapA family protein n=1 Tax=Rhodococcus sp. TaxID=1831 RepID=UPI003BB00700